MADSVGFSINAWGYKVYYSYETEPWVAQYSTNVLFHQAATTILLFLNLNYPVLYTLCDGIGA